MSDTIDVRMDKPFCPQCDLPMQLSHVESARHDASTKLAHDRFTWRCACGEVLEKTALQDSLV